MGIRIAVVGGGGKTSAIRDLAATLTDHRVLWTTTTHIFPEEPTESRVLLVSPNRETLLSALTQPGIVCAGARAREGKLGALAQPLLEEAAESAELMLCEADGARHLPLKLHRPGEPVVPPKTDCCLMVAGLSALGQTVASAVHCYGEHPAWAKEPQRRVGVEEFLFCVEETVDASGVPREHSKILLQQEPVLSEREHALEVFRQLQERGFDCRMAHLSKDRDFLKHWLLPLW